MFLLILYSLCPTPWVAPPNVGMGGATTGPDPKAVTRKHCHKHTEHSLKKTSTPTQSLEFVIKIVGWLDFYDLTSKVKSGRESTCVNAHPW